MTIDQFREAYGAAWYGIINSELGQALITVLEKNDPVTRASHQPQEVQKAMADMYFWQVTAWRDCIETIEKRLIVRDGKPQTDIESTYGAEEIAGASEGSLLPTPPPPPPRTVKRKRKSK